jgi:hypothetical protein
MVNCHAFIGCPRITEPFYDSFRSDDLFGVQGYADKQAGRLAQTSQGQNKLPCIGRIDQALSPVLQASVIICAHNPRSDYFARVLDSLLGGLAEFEKELFRTRTSEGRERAKARGVKLGRKPKLTERQKREAIRRRNIEGSRGAATTIDNGRAADQ